MNVKEYLDAMGYTGEDKVTGFFGVIDSVCFDLYGCVQVSLRPGVTDKGDLPDGRWFDSSRLTINRDKRVMDPPDYDYGSIAEGKKGPAIKPNRCDPVAR